MAFVGFLLGRWGRAFVWFTGVLVAALGIVWVVSLVIEVNSAPNQLGHHDFFSFYSAAAAIARGHIEWLYQATPLAEIQRTILDSPVGAAGYMPYLNPPFAAAAQLPFALLSEPLARNCWLAINLVILLATLKGLGSPLRPNNHVLAILLLALTFPVYQALVEGQWSLVMLAGCLYSIDQGRQRNWSRSGASLAVLAIKPPLFFMVLFWLVIQRRWRIALSSLAAVGALVLLALPITGFSTYASYAQFLMNVSISHVVGAGAAGTSTWEGAVANMEGLNGLFTAYLGQQHFLLVDGLTTAVDVVLIAALAGASVVSHKRSAETNWLTGAAFLSAFLVDPHLYAQDCVLLLVGLAMLLPRIASGQQRMWAVVATAALMDLSALDTTWAVPGFPAPHLLTACLFAGVVICLFQQLKLVGSLKQRELARSLELAS